MPSNRNPTIHTELGEERLCKGCGEFWPTDDPDKIFWYWTTDRYGTYRIMGRCKGCVSERIVDGTSRRYRPMLVTA